jgi:hypothetical protein
MFWKIQIYFLENPETQDMLFGANLTIFIQCQSIPNSEARHNDSLIQEFVGFKL